MIELMPQMEPRDLARTYEGTYLKFKTRDSDCFYPARLSAVFQETDGIYLRLQKATSEYVLVPAYDKEECVVDVSWPNLGFVNYKTTALFLARKLETQWKRGLRRSQLEMKFVSYQISREYYDIESEGYFHTQEFLESLYYPEYPSYREAAQMVLDGKAIAKAISHNIAIANHIALDKPVVFFQNNEVGFLDDDLTIHLLNTAKHLKNTIEDKTDGYHTRVLPPFEG